MWTRENRGLYERRGARYPSDLSDEEWALIAPLVPPAKRGGRRREVDVREVMNGVLYVLETGCQWRALPKDLPPKSTVHDYLTLWDWDGTLERVHHALYLMTRDLRGGPRESDSCDRWDPAFMRRISGYGEATEFFGGLQGESCA